METRKLILALRCQRRFHFQDHIGGHFCVHVRRKRPLAKFSRCGIFCASWEFPKVVTFSELARGSGLQDGPERVISSENVTPNATPKIRTDGRTNERRNPGPGSAPPPYARSGRNMRRSGVAFRPPPSLQYTYVLRRVPAGDHGY